MMLALAVLTLSQIVTAESLPDPTRPAIDLGGSGSAAVPAEVAPQGLQSTIISPQYRAAIINGETVRLGGKSGDSRLVEVHETSVVLQNAQGRHVMELFPKAGIVKNEVGLQKSHVQESKSGQEKLPEKAVGGVK